MKSLTKKRLWFLLSMLALVIFFHFNFVLVGVDGISMEPTFLDKEKIVAVRYPVWFGLLKEGDVVVTTDPTDNGILLKRIIKIKDDKVWIEGDNKKHSADSRYFGWIDIKTIDCRVIE